MAPSSEWPHPSVTGGPSGRRVQYAALPYRVRRDGEVQIRLITSRETRRWVIPKGWPIKGLTPPKTAARECYEEAGLVGVVSREPVGMYTYEKRLGTRSVLCDVLVFPLKVKRLLQKWPERFQRYGFWFSIETAAAAVQEEDLSDLILAFGAIMARTQAEKEAIAASQAAAEAEAEAEAAGVPKAKSAGKRGSGEPAPDAAAQARLAQADGSGPYDPDGARGKAAGAKAAGVKAARVKAKAAKSKAPDSRAQTQKAGAVETVTDGSGSAGGSNSVPEIAPPATDTRAPSKQAGSPARPKDRKSKRSEAAAATSRTPDPDAVPDDAAAAPQAAGAKGKKAQDRKEGGRKKASKDMAGKDTAGKSAGKKQTPSPSGRKAKGNRLPADG